MRRRSSLVSFTFDRADIFFQIFSALGSGNRNNVVALREHPRERELRGRAFLFAGDLFDATHQIEILLEVFSLKARRVTAIIVGCEVFEFLKLPGQKSAAEWAIGDETNAEFAAGGQNFVFGIARPERIFGLQRCDGMDFHGAAKRLRRRPRRVRDSEPCLPSLSSAIAPTVSSMGVLGSTRCW